MASRNSLKNYDIYKYHSLKRFIFEEHFMKYYRDYIRNENRRKNFLQLLTKAISIFPQAEHYYFRAIIHQKDKNFSAALWDIQKALEKKPKVEKYMILYTILLLKLRNYQKTIEESTKLLKFNPRSTIAWILKAIAYLREKKKEKAIRALQRANSLEPNLNIHVSKKAGHLEIFLDFRSFPKASSLEAAVELFFSNER